MQTTRSFMGMDVHKATITIRIAEDGRDGAVRFIGVIPNAPDDIAKMAKRLSKHGELDFCYEAGGCGYNIPSNEQFTELGMDPNQSAMAWEHTNIWAAGRLLGTYDTDGLHFYFDDPLGTRRAQSDYAGVLEQTCASLPSGNAEPCKPTPTEHLFTGKERDTESGLDYFGARYYGSNMGRFMSPDPIKITEDRVANPSTLNLYEYAANNPLKYVAPDGQDITYFYDQASIAGHAVIFAYNQQTGDGAIESFGPIIHSPMAAGESMFDLGPNITADKLRNTFAALTMQTSPELAQQVIDYIRSNPDPDNWKAWGPNCSTQCAKILQKFKLEMSRDKGKRPKLLWNAFKQQYNPNAPAKPTGGLDYGAPRRDMFGPFWNQIQQNWKDDPSRERQRRTLLLLA
jgi:RHS repeat-associated protein